MGMAAGEARDWRGGEGAGLLHWSWRGVGGIMRMGLRVGLNAIGSVLGHAGKVDFEPESLASDGEGIK